MTDVTIGPQLKCARCGDTAGPFNTYAVDVHGDRFLDWDPKSIERDEDSHECELCATCSRLDDRFAWLLQGALAFGDEPTSTPTEPVRLDSISAAELRMIAALQRLEPVWIAEMAQCVLGETVGSDDEWGDLVWAAVMAVASERGYRQGKPPTDTLTRVELALVELSKSSAGDALRAAIAGLSEQARSELTAAIHRGHFAR